MLNQELQKETIRHSDERFRRMIEEIEDYAIILLDENGIIQNWNKGAHKIKGYAANEIIGQHFRIFYTKQDQATKLPERLLAEAAKNSRASHEGWRIRKDGSLFWGYIVITALHDDKGRIIGFSKITRDLSALKRAEELQQEYISQLEELRRSEERYHKMIDEVKDYAILRLDLDGNILDWNQGAERIKGYSSNEIIGKNFRIFYLPEDREGGLPERLLNEASTTGRAVHEGWRRRKDGTNFWGSIVITALHDEDGTVIGYSKVTRDLTDKKLADDKIKQYAAQLEQKNQELEEFAYIASHDLKEPLRKVVAFGDLLNNAKASLDPKTIGYIDRMQDSAHRMMSLIEDLLQFSRIGKEEQELEPTDLNKVVDRVIQDLEPTIQNKHAVINKEDLPTIMARPLQMEQLFMNLISNALKFNDKDVPIIEIVNTPIIDHPSGEPHCEILVKDNGIGFDEEHRA
ncbi:MAG TPA: PAS domain S-box protein, partial [Chitinophagaceae bacterium]|nr:PAS domain S-box protein [Chitinophagaceae bacterium]